MKFIFFSFIIFQFCLDLTTPIVVGFAKPVEPSAKDYPFHVNILMNIAEEEGKFEYWSTCGAGLIHPIWVLTAAHCIQSTKKEDPLKPEETFLSMGSIIRNGTDGQILPADKIIAHDKYLNDLESDIGLISVKQPGFKIGDTIKPIKIFLDSDSLIGQTAYLTGFGVMNDLMQLPEKLRLAKFTIDSNWKCLDVGHDSTHLCAVSWIEGGGKACKGDSGGPLFIINNGVPMQIGITSRLSILPICQLHMNNGIYARVSAFKDWIIAKTNITQW